MNAIDTVGFSGERHSPDYISTKNLLQNYSDIGSNLVKNTRKKLSGLSFSLFIADSEAFVVDNESSDIEIDYLPKKLYERAYRQVDNLRQNPANYSDNDPNVPSPVQETTAKAALFKLAESGLPEPKIMLLDDGTLSAYWFIDNKNYASIDFDASKNLIWGIDEEGCITVGEFSLDDTIPHEIISLLTKTKTIK